MAIYDGSDPRMQQGGNQNQLRQPGQMGLRPMFGNMTNGKNPPMFGGGSGMMNGRSPAGGYGDPRGDHNPPRPMYKEHPNHPDYAPGPGNYDPNNYWTRPKPKPTKPSLVDMLLHKEELEEFARGLRQLW